MGDRVAKNYNKTILLFKVINWGICKFSSFKPLNVSGTNIFLFKFPRITDNEN